jgi:hypothetical protein
VSARRLALRAAAALAAALLASPALAFVRTADRATGAPLAWPLPIVPWHLNRDWPYTSPSCASTAPVYDPALDVTTTTDLTLAAVRASFAQWEQPGSDLELLYAGESPEIRVGAGGSGGNVVVFRRGWCSQNADALADGCLDDLYGDCGARFGCFDDGQTCVGSTACAQWRVVALTSVLYDPATGRIMSADIEVNGWDGNGKGTPLGVYPRFGWYFTCYSGATQTQQPQACTTFGQDRCAYMDLQNTVTHEVGHFVGLAHPCGDAASSAGAPDCYSAPRDNSDVPYVDRTMSPTADQREVKKRVLSPDEVAGIRAIYPATSGCACAVGGGAGAFSALLAALALRPLRRRRVR